MNIEASEKRFIRFERALPWQVREVISRKPIAYVPLGALEWHGEHAALGLDGLKAQSICELAAQRTGGVLFPTVQWGAFHTLRYPFTFHFSKRPMKLFIRRLLGELADWGFRVAILLAGHYPLAQITLLRRECRRASRLGRIAALGIPEQALALDLGYLGDHAAMWETSLLMAIDPSLVDLSQLPDDTGTLWQRSKKHGIYGICPKKHANPELGRETLKLIVDRLAATAERLLADGHADAAEEIYRAHEKAFRHPLAAGRRAFGTDSNWEIIRFVIGNIFRMRHL